MTISRAVLVKIVEIVDNSLHDSPEPTSVQRLIKIRELCIAELLDPLKLSQIHAMTHKRDPSAPSDWCRCIYTETDELTGALKRCILGDPHGDEPHRFAAKQELLPQ